MKLRELFESEPTQVRWVIGNLGSNGLLLKCLGTTIKLDHIHSAALIAALKADDEVTVKTTDNSEFKFTPDQRGQFVALKVGDESPDTDGLLLTQHDVEEILSMESEQKHAPQPENPNEI